mmetsp:Transcript_22013/g.18871  ORF Transcript_22013/g.18871 Transcript_22013/m.18871 type:complete len:97 (+) Transcript_22013:601-891(+)|eukprot:CAMPEP_0114589586 /NCGR_PEP_ID=MMETSP0125-20121206/12004_1 /TAXON_ID=485358 ORGANISM="Aristerostoma sp., Strain ATCC 50986" /NCGR_SAMPLE_ID=MMETSP0125 /ASSEMBLY_ACC=CAM_ASM_000245 /LENGTH=96 /DNA_ID=CAMNT_0001786561 /DNA_START=516 /DNA_END=806 /DNA_ORIENTATION=-
MKLKIIDFDNSHKKGDDFLMSKGTKHYRAPELLKPNRNFNPAAADIYSAAVVLFRMLIGSFPLQEIDDGFNELAKLFEAKEQAFWDYHTSLVDDDL